MAGGSENQAVGNVGTSEREVIVEDSQKEKEDNAKKERRTKKRNERPSSSDDDDHVPLASKLQIERKTVTSRPAKRPFKASKGMSTEPNMISTPEAQSIPLPNPTIDFTKPISMILPDPQPETINVSSSSSSSEDTLSDSSLDRVVDRVIANAPKVAPTKSIDSQEVVPNDISILNHLASHMSGDALTSNLNSPNDQINHASPMHIDSEPEPENPPNTSTNTEPIPQEHHIPLSPISIETLSDDSPLHLLSNTFQNLNL
jgi:hypothetical protein